MLEPRNSPVDVGNLDLAVGSPVTSVRALPRRNREAVWVRTRMPCISWRSDVATTTQTNPKQDHVTFRISVERLTRILIWTVLALAVTNLIAQILRWKGKAADISRFFDGNQKVNIPTGYKVFMLVASALTVLAIARAARNANDPWAGRWYFLAAVVGLLAFDETAYVHQSLSDFLDKHFQSESLPHFKWVIVYLPAAAIIIAGLWRFVRSLSPRTKRWFAIGALLFIGGSGGLELVKGKLADNSDINTSGQFLTAAGISDTLEEIGLAIFLLGGLRELSTRVSAVRLEVDDPERTA